MLFYSCKWQFWIWVWKQFCPLYCVNKYPSSFWVSFHSTESATPTLNALLVIFSITGDDSWTVLFAGGLVFKSSPSVVVSLRSLSVVFGDGSLSLSPPPTSFYPSLLASFITITSKRLLVLSNIESTVEDASITAVIVSSATATTSVPPSSTVGFVDTFSPTTVTDCSYTVPLSSSGTAWVDLMLTSTIFVTPLPKSNCTWTCQMLRPVLVFFLMTYLAWQQWFQESIKKTSVDSYV